MLLHEHPSTLPARFFYYRSWRMLSSTLSSMFGSRVGTRLHWGLASCLIVALVATCTRRLILWIRDEGTCSHRYYRQVEVSYMKTEISSSAWTTFMPEVAFFERPYQLRMLFELSAKWSCRLKVRQQDSYYDFQTWRAPCFNMQGRFGDNKKRPHRLRPHVVEN